MNKQRKVLVTITYNEMGIIIDTKTEKVPERLTDDDFETIRIHLNAYKEKLCNQQRWEEAEEYQRIIDRFMAFASVQPEKPEQPESAKEYCMECDHIEMCRWYPYEGCEFRSLPSAQPDVSDIDDEDTINRWAAIDEITEYGGGRTLYMSVGELRRRLEDLPPAKKEITLEDVKAYCEPRCLQIVTTDMMLQSQEEKEIKRLRELAARILGKYEEEKKKQLAAVRLASLRGSERDRAKELQARAVREIENLRKEIKGE